MSHYKVIYADPPWTFATYSKKGKGRSPEAHYDCMSFDAIKELPVADWASKDSILLLWVTDPLLPKGLELLDAWGFTYKTVGFYWAKLNKAGSPHAYSDRDFFTGMGFWTRANPEQCLLATRGKPKRIAKDVRRLVVAPRREHSRKPDEVYENIERLADGPYLEMFARSSRQGWDSWGNQEELFDQGSVKTRRWSSDLSKSRPHL
ncbi:MAG: MT-A70 family methyltransferase [Alphaproteobacteria bacterium]